MTISPEPRIPPLALTELTDQMRELLAAGTPDGKPRTEGFYRTMVRHPRLYRRWVAWARWPLVKGRLPLRVREIAILRNAWLCQAEIEWGEHVAIAKQGGNPTGAEVEWGEHAATAKQGGVLTGAEIEQIIAGPGHSGWAPFDAAVVRAIDELHTDARLSDATWNTLAEEFDDVLFIEFFMILGNYRMLAWIQNSFRTQRRPGSAGLEAR